MAYGRSEFVATKMNYIGGFHLENVRSYPKIDNFESNKWQVPSVQLE